MATATSRLLSPKGYTLQHRKWHHCNKAFVVHRKNHDNVRGYKRTYKYNKVEHIWLTFITDQIVTRGSQRRVLSQQLVRAVVGHRAPLEHGGPDVHGAQLLRVYGGVRGGQAAGTQGGWVFLQ